MSSGEIGAHSASKDPRKLLLPDPERNISWLSNKAIPGILAGLGYAMFAVSNVMMRRPIHSGIWRHILAAGVGIPVGVWYNEYREERMAEYDALLRWYIDQHPDHFPTPERVKVGDMFKKWTPVR